MNLENITKDRDVVVIAGLDGLDDAIEITGRGYERVSIIIPEPYVQFAPKDPPVPIISTPSEMVDLFCNYTNPAPKKAAFGSSPHNGFSAESIEKISDVIKQTIHRVASNEGTLEVFGELWQKNAKENLDRIQALQAPVMAEAPKWEGKPMVVVGAGPSLDSCIDELVKVRDEVCVAAVSHSLLALETVGIIPDYCMVLDAQDVRWHFNLASTSYIERVTALLGVTAMPELYKLPFRDIIPFNGNRDVADWVNEHMDEPIHSLVAGGSVLTSLALMGIEWGCSKVCLIGSDLSFPGGKAYADMTCDGGATITLGEDNKTFTYNNGSDGFKSVAGDKTRPMITVDGIWGGKLPSCLQFQIYIAYLNWLATENKGRVYQCATQGAKILGATHCSLTEALA